MHLGVFQYSAPLNGTRWAIWWTGPVRVKCLAQEHNVVLHLITLFRVQHTKPPHLHVKTKSSVIDSKLPEIVALRSLANCLITKLTLSLGFAMPAISTYLKSYNIVFNSFLYIIKNIGLKGVTTFLFLNPIKTNGYEKIQ